MADTTMQIVVSDGDINATIDAIESALPEGAAIIPPVADTQSLADAFQGAVEAAGDLPSIFGAWWRAARDADGIDPALSLLIFALIIAVAYGIERAAQALILKRSLEATPADKKFSSKFRVAARWAVRRVLLLLLFCGLSYVGITLVTGEQSQSAVLAIAMFAAILRFRIVLLLAGFMAAPSSPARRLIALTDDEAEFVKRAMMVLLAALAVTSFTNDSVLAAAGTRDASALFASTIVCLEGLIGISFFFVIRRPIASAIRHGLASSASSAEIAAYFANCWHLVYSALIILSATIQVVEHLTLQSFGASDAARYSIQIFILVPFAIAGLRTWRDERLADMDVKKRSFPIGLFALAEGVVIMLAAILILLTWKIDPFSAGGSGFQRILPNLISAALTLAIGIAVWRAVFAFLDAYAPGEGEDRGNVLEDEGGGSEGSRFKTVYPVLRGCFMATIVTITTLVVLSEWGVQIGPLIAGAGVIGLAVGFGSQTLVKDIISGIFYLYEDAFRVGEYISTGEGKGVVEKILLRSVRLRASRGPIFTIPFGSMGTIENHSRDWVKVKFLIEVDASEDLERIRKLIKKVGLQLAEDPEIKDSFLQPLKSQGAVGIVGANYQIGIKFICKPGEQFLIRRKAFVALQNTIREHGIELATPRVMVQNPKESAAGAVAAASALPKPQAST